MGSFASVKYVNGKGGRGGEDVVLTPFSTEYYVSKEGMR